MVVPVLSEGSGSGLRLARSLELVRPAQVRHPMAADSQPYKHRLISDSSGSESKLDRTLPASHHACASPG